MTVKELKQILNESPDDMQVMILNELPTGLFVFEDACPAETGEVEVGPSPDGRDQFQGKVFCVLPHRHEHSEEEAKAEALN